MWNGKALILGRLRPFACVAYAHKRKGKLDLIAIKCVQLGYAEGVKDYRLWQYEEKGITTIVIRDVTFNEDGFPYYHSTNKDACTKPTPYIRTNTLQVDQHSNHGWQFVPWVGSWWVQLANPNPIVYVSCQEILTLTRPVIFTC